MGVINSLGVEMEMVDEQLSIYSSTNFLPFILLRNDDGGIVSSRRINTPYFDIGNVVDERFSEMAVAWFGRVTPTENYTDIRVGYNDSNLYVYLAVFDRRLWYDETPSVGDLQQWDAATLYLRLNGNTGDTIDLNSYQFVAQFTPFPEPEARTDYQVSYRGDGYGWVDSDIPFATTSGWRGDAWNNDNDDRGWAVTFEIPFNSLGLINKPGNGSVWGISVVLHDRDDLSGTYVPHQNWPENVDEEKPATWGQIHFGLPIYTPPPKESNGAVIIRHNLNGSIVEDAAVGGTTNNLCPGDTFYIWNEWGDENFSGAPDFNVQNQSDVADWPCFSKYFITFPLDAIPQGKNIRLANLTIHQYGNSGNVNDPDPFYRPKPSLIQILTVNDDWEENSLTWNNAPMAHENVSQAWAYPLSDFPGWPGVPITWDISYATAQAYSSNQPLRLALYEADAAYHSGKYFVSSDVDDWNEIGRPTLVVEWSDP
jgi:hypothetical protein